jgi:hypothetical protein
LAAALVTKAQAREEVCSSWRKKKSVVAGSAEAVAGIVAAIPCSALDAYGIGIIAGAVVILAGSAGTSVESAA